MNSDFNLLDGNFSEVKSVNLFYSSYHVGVFQTLFRLAEWPEHRSHMKNFIGMVDQLQAVASKWV